jgi:transcriptional regulator with XRE-family HTH domain
MAGADTDTHQYLRAWRRHRKKTLEKVAEAIGSKVNTISGWETGNRGINLDDLSRLAGVYEVSPADLLQSPAEYERRQSAGRLVEIADRLTPDQAAHLFWLAEEMASLAPRPAGADPPRLPFPQEGGCVKKNQASGDCETTTPVPKVLTPALRVVAPAERR